MSGLPWGAAGYAAVRDITLYCRAGAVAGLNRGALHMFQQDALLAWKSVLEDIMLGPRFRKTRRRRPPASGGIRKRGAMAQSWIINPDVVLTRRLARWTS